jgi:hypothetical protein
MGRVGRLARRFAAGSRRNKTRPQSAAQSSNFTGGSDMSTKFNAGRRHPHLSRRERQRLARVEAFSRRTATAPVAVPVVAFGAAEVALIERLVRHDRTAVSTALLAVAGIGAGEVKRRAVLGQVGETARRAQTGGEISSERGAQIARHVSRALDGCERGITA